MYPRCPHLRRSCVIPLLSSKSTAFAIAPPEYSVLSLEENLKFSCRGWDALGIKVIKTAQVVQSSAHRHTGNLSIFGANDVSGAWSPGKFTPSKNFCRLGSVKGIQTHAMSHVKFSDRCQQRFWLVYKLEVCFPLYTLYYTHVTNLIQFRIKRLHWLWWPVRKSCWLHTKTLKLCKKLWGKLWPVGVESHILFHRKKRRKSRLGPSQKVPQTKWRQSIEEWKGRVQTVVCLQFCLRQIFILSLVHSCLFSIFSDSPKIIQ